MRRKTVILMILAAAAVLITAGTTISRPLHGRVQEVVSALPSGWSTPVNISNQGGGSEAPTIVVDNSGRVYATWTEWFGSVGAPRAMMYNSTTASGTWPDSQGSYLAYAAIDDVGFPTIVCTPTGGTAMVTYHDGNFAIGHMGILARLFTNGTLNGEGFIPGLPMSCSYVTSAYNPVDKTVLFHLPVRRLSKTSSSSWPWSASIRRPPMEPHRLSPRQDGLEPLLAPPGLRSQGNGPPSLHHPLPGRRPLLQEPHPQQSGYLDRADRPLRRHGPRLGLRLHRRGQRRRPLRRLVRQHGRLRERDRGSLVQQDGQRRLADEAQPDQ